MPKQLNITNPYDVTAVSEKKPEIPVILKRVVVPTDGPLERNCIPSLHQVETPPAKDAVEALFQICFKLKELNMLDEVLDSDSKRTWKRFEAQYQRNLTTYTQLKDKPISEIFELPTMELHNLLDLVKASNSTIQVI